MVRMIASVMSHTVSSRPGLPTGIEVFQEQLTILDAQLKGPLVPADLGRGDVHSRLQVKADFMAGTDHGVLYQTPSRQQAPRVIAPVVESPIFPCHSGHHDVPLANFKTAHLAVGEIGWSQADPHWSFPRRATGASRYTPAIEMYQETSRSPPTPHELSR